MVGTRRILNGELDVLLSSFGASILSLKWRGVEMTVHDGSESNPFYMGCIVGRVAGRIRNGTFRIDDVKYSMEANAGGHLLHGGRHGWSHVYWHVSWHDAQSVVFELIDPKDGFPGRVHARVRYEVDESALVISFDCETDAPTIVSMTNHTYWNLNGKASKITNHILRVSNASRIVEIDEDLVPTGRLLHCSDFEKAARLNKPMDHTLVVDDDRQIEAILRGDRAAIRLKTSQPGLHVYIANFLPYAESAVCLETQHLPDSINHLDTFPKGSLITPTQPYSHVTRLRFEDPSTTFM